MLQVNTEVFCPSARKKEQGKSDGREYCRSELREMRAAMGMWVRGWIADVSCQREPSGEMEGEE